MAGAGRCETRHSDVFAEGWPGRNAGATVVPPPGTTEHQLGDDPRGPVFCAHGMAGAGRCERRYSDVFAEGRPGRNDARDKSRLRPSNCLQLIEKHRVFALRGRAGMLGLHFCPLRQECRGYGCYPPLGPPSTSSVPVSISLRLGGSLSLTRGSRRPPPGSGEHQLGGKQAAPI